MLEVAESVKMTCVLNLLNTAGSTSPVAASAIGLSEDLVFKIQNLTNKEMSCLTQAYSKDIVQVKIDIARLEYFLGRVKLSCEEDDYVLKFIRLGASTPLIVKLFGLQNSEVTALRKAVGFETNSGGRPSCSIEERFDVIASWEKCDSVDERERYLFVAEDTKLSLKVIHMVVMQNSKSKSLTDTLSLATA
jgi:hypothetical protein